MDWLLYDNGLRRERVKCSHFLCALSALLAVLYKAVNCTLLSLTK